AAPPACRPAATSPAPVAPSFQDLLGNALPPDRARAGPARSAPGRTPAPPIPDSTTTSPTARAAERRSPVPNAPADSSGHLPAGEVALPTRTEILKRRIIRCNMTVRQLLPGR